MGYTSNTGKENLIHLSQNKLILVQHNRLNIIHQYKLIIVHRNKLILKLKGLWQQLPKNWQHH